MSALTIQLAKLDKLRELFQFFNSGKHLNRLSEPELWAALEQQQEQYQTLFEQLGYRLRIDGRGFAWFHTEDGNSNVSKTTRNLALVLMVLFDYQADNQKSLARFSDWLIDSLLVQAIFDKHKELLLAEGLDVDAMMQIYDTAVRYGFAQSQDGAWRLLPAATRYLDHFEELAQHHNTTEQDAIDTKQEEDLP
ncbi:MAG: hypothetical protein IT465_04070 [Moraxellaceae bacterium]|nr:hypothetical protein [Moraxellaceae bacterium]